MSDITVDETSFGKHSKSILHNHPVLACGNVKSSFKNKNKIKKRAMQRK